MGGVEEARDTDLAAAAEKRRIRELFKYFRAASQDVGIVDIDSHASYNPGIARLASDPALTAFAQLGALRLDCDRSFISLIDSHEQHIIAEASRTVSLYVADSHQQGDELCLGARPLDLSGGVCAGTMKVFTSPDDRHDVATANISADHNQYIINDFTKEDLYKDRPYVTGFPHMRFYAEVPLKSPSGYVLGSYCVVDKKPRAGLDSNGIAVLKEIAETVMKHLDLVKLKEEHARNEGLLQGLNYFVQGKWGVHHGIPDGPKQKRKKNTQNKALYKAASPDSLPSNQEYLSAAASKAQEVTSDSKSQIEVNALLPTSKVGILVPSTIEPHSTSPPQFARLSSEEAKTRSSSAEETGSFGASETPNTRTTPTQSKISDEIRENFAEASALLRQAMDLDGVVFLNAAPGQLVPRGTPGDSHHVSEPIPSISLVHSVIEEQRPPTARTRTNLTTENVMAERLGFSTQQKSSSTGDYLSDGMFSLPEVIHKSLLKHYPQGHVFNFDGSGPVSSSGEESLAHEATGASDAVFRRRQKRRKEEAAIRRCFPKVRSLIFVPLWDPHKEAWFVGCLGWTCQEKRILQSRESAYFSAFGNSLMVETHRLELLETDRVKSDFISSISHELRSPLHGILGSAELLREMTTHGDQDDMIDMIDNCGRTLLETMDHLLDFAKINNMTQSRSRKWKSSNPSLDSRSHGHTDSESSFDLSVLIEDLVEGVLAGYRFNHRSSDSQPGQNNARYHTYAELVQESSLDQCKKQGSSLSVILSIDDCLDWHIKSEPGAWRRILVNLLGNAMKYTTSGYVQVALRLGPESTTAGPSEGQTMAIVTISDTGCGIGKTYLKHHLFKPFAQENSLAVGTGLGLSIVKQITKSLDGRTDVRSEVGVGTEVAVSVPVSLLSAPTATAERSRQPRILSLLLLGFDYSETEISTSSRLALALKRTLTNQAEQHFGLLVVSDRDASASNADIVTVMDDKLDLLHTYDSANGDAHLATAKSPLIIFSSDILADNRSKYQKMNKIEYLSQPFGPRKIAKAIGACLQHLEHVSDQPSGLALRPALDSATTDTILTGNIVPVSDVPTERTEDFRDHGVHLPRSALSSTDRSDPETSTLPHEELPRRPQLLFVDDNAINLKLLVAHARKMNYQYASAMNGLEAVNLYRQATRPFDYVLMDISMPVMDGFVATGKIRDYERSCSLSPCTIVALTGLGTAKAQQEAFACGVSLFLTKPLSLKKLKTLVENGSIPE